MLKKSIFGLIFATSFTFSGMVFAVTELSMWYHGAGNEVESKLIKQIISDFNSSQSNWRVNLESFPQESYNSSVVAAALFLIPRGNSWECGSSDTIGKASLQEPCPIQIWSIMTQKAEMCCSVDSLINQSIVLKKCLPNMMIHNCFFNLSLRNETRYSRLRKNCFGTL